ncbi:Uncharacterized membrane protein YjjP, DUF1212 family [Amphibacillus marinus]|uniref:Uncharacterized membrane protein YjjP, DUF1212 family n=1 Tax=Amphibacillus marinus TaxID=872970 RepID=A0A1H8MGC1_9BACI|nr:threonine/serine exporter family protein [Amphibacillus marinus]SEO16268.1 Uncharacterized membrane protein YjjP, DUF1212 family [Amphibacillus marinus]
MKREYVVKVCLLAGKIMLQNGAETYRVEDTMVRIAQAYGFEGAQSHATPTAIMFASDITEPTNFVRIVERETDLHKVSQVNSISRLISAEKLIIEDAYEQLTVVAQQKDTYPTLIKLLAAALSSGCFMIMFGGQWYDFISAMLVGGIGYGMVTYFHQLIKVRFFAEFLAAMVMGFSSFLLVNAGIGGDIDRIIIGAVMPLVPGLLITNAVRDLMAGHLVSGITKGADACLTALAIGAGIAVIFFIV